MSRLRALLATLRIANAPSVVGNLWLGFMLGAYQWGLSLVRSLWGGSPLAHDTYLIVGDGPATLLPLSALIASALGLYFAGNLANDWYDRHWDARHRPERALPRALFPAWSYLLAAVLLGGLSCVLAASISPWCLAVAAILCGLIALYTFLHKRTRWAVIPMGLCRAALYALGFVASTPDWDTLTGTPAYSFASPAAAGTVLVPGAFLATHALGLLVYIAGLSLAARYEATEHPPHGMVVLSRAMLFLPLAAMSSWWMPYYPLMASLALVPFALWLALSLTRLRKPVPRLVSALLAGIPLIDFIAALPLAAALSLPDQGLHQQPLLLATVLVPLAAFGAALLLQKVAPAT